MLTINRIELPFERGSEYRRTRRRLARVNGRRRARRVSVNPTWMGPCNFVASWTFTANEVR